jgi:hypothetical protein
MAPNGELLPRFFPGIGALNFGMALGTEIRGERTLYHHGNQVSAEHQAVLIEAALPARTTPPFNPWLQRKRL